MIRTIIITCFAAVLFVPLGQAEMKHDEEFCRSGIVKLLSGDKGATVLAIEMTGIGSNTGETSQCIGVISIIAGKRKGYGYCKIMGPNGDFKLAEWTSSAKQGEGTWKFLYGTGKWKGIAGGGEYKPGSFLELRLDHNDPHDLPTVIVPLCRGLSGIVFN